MEALTPEQFLAKYFDERPGEIDLPEEFEELKGSAEELSEEERAEELEDMSSEELGEAFRLNQD